jgi:hypothetical protein
VTPTERREIRLRTRLAAAAGMRLTGADMRKRIDWRLVRKIARRLLALPGNALTTRELSRLRVKQP